MDNKDLNALADAVARRVGAEKELQTLLKLRYHSMRQQNLAPSELPSFDEVGFRRYSQFEEDGILLFLFSMVGTTNKKVVEICAGHGMECMAANLIINHGWYGYLFDGDEYNVRKGRDFYRTHPDTFIMPPVFEQAWLTAENINTLLKDAGVQGEVDLLSIDIDGNDYWLWESITSINPRVVVCETHNIVPADKALTRPYNPEFSYTSLPESEQDFRSASLLAMARLGKRKGYRLVGTHRHGFNAFFMREDVGVKYFPEVSVEACVTDPYSDHCRNTRWPQVEKMAWTEIED